MYDPTFHPKTLHAELNLADYLRDKALFNPAYEDALITKSIARVAAGYGGVKLKSNSINKSTVYQLSDLADEIVLRKIGRNIKRVTRVRQTNRTSIVKCLRRLTSEGLPFRVYKIDIKNFYASIDTKLLLAPIITDSAFPPSTISLLESFFSEMARLEISGLPRGLGLSAVLSEYVMRDFDSQVGRIPGVFFYARFVDDMIFITSGTEEPNKFLKSINSTLPTGLFFNPTKTRPYFFGPQVKGVPFKIEHEVDFLGYVFRIGNAQRSGPKINRDIIVDISDKKVKRIKTRICVALREYIKDRNFENLTDRIRMLTANYTFFDAATKTRRKAGIYHSYHLIDAEKSTSLDELDLFLKKMLLSNQGKICRELFGLLDRRDRRYLMKYSFSRGFHNRTYFHLPTNRIAYLRRCWNNG
ncbi:antiviral reverse transcriptase Drt3a [Methylobacterium sp.]|uniref:antiviral reverse transcriptase Drt3a n=1 Tax=Methylobacterium sp. TaxID=409 RepID=UPI003D10DC58